MNVKRKMKNKYNLSHKNVLKNDFFEIFILFELVVVGLFALKLDDV